MRWLAVMAGACVIAAPLAAQVSTWKSDPAHSEIDFTIRHLSVSDVHGRFGRVNATIQYDAADVTRSKVTATVDVESVTTGESGRDDEIRSGDFFDVERFPKATFSSTAVSNNGKGLWVKGNLTLHGITRQIVLDVRGPDKPVMGSDGKPHSGFFATATLNRTAFDIGTTFPAAIVGDPVKLTIKLPVVKQ